MLGETRHRLGWFVILPALAVLTAGRSAPGAPDDQAMARPPIISASEIDYPPFCIVDAEGHAGGFSVELMRAALAAMGRDVTFRTGTWPEVRGWLERGEVQALPLVGRTPERETLFDFTVPYMTLHGAIVVRTDTNDIRTLDDLRGRRVAVMQGDNAEEFLRREERGIDIRTTPTFEVALRELSEGHHDAVVIQRLVALRLIEQGGHTNLKVVNRPIEGFRQDFCFAVRKGNAETLALLNEGLALVIADGTHRRLHAKWFAALELPSDRRIVIGGDNNFPPFEFLDEHGRPAGFNVDLTRAIAQATGLEIEIRLGPWTKVREALARGDIDAIQGMFYSPERALTFDFSPPHAVNHCVSVVRRGEGPPPDTLEGLTGKHIVVQEGDILHDFVLEQEVQAQITAVKSQEDALRELAEGRYDCALVSRWTALHLTDRHGWDNLVLGTHSFLAPEYCYAVPKGHRALLAQISEGLKLLEESGEYRRIYDKWLGVYREEQPSFPEILRDALWVILALLALTLLVLLWSWTLRRRVAARTKQLRASEAYQRSMIACSPVALYSIDLQGIVQSWNDSAERIFGWTAEEVIGCPLPIVPEEKRTEYDALRAQLLEGRGLTAREVVRLRKDGTTFMGSLSTAPIYDDHGRMTGIMCAMEDITQRKEIEASRELLAAAIEQVREIILITKPDGSIEYVNPAFERVTGYTRAEVLGKNPRILNSGTHDADFFGNLWRTISLGNTWEGRITNKRKDGTLYTEDATVSPVRGPDGRVLHYVAVKRDITAQLVLEEQFRQAQKMEAIGQLAGGVAHDFNNILQAIMGHTQILLEDFSGGAEDREDIEQILRNAERASTLTRQLLMFSRRQVMHPEIIGLNQTVEDMLKMLRRILGEQTRVEWLPGNRLGAVYADAGMMDQVLMNLCVNARDAMPGGGTLTIETQNVLIDSEYCSSHVWAKPGRYVLLSVTDTGCGMDHATLKRMFEPFFTTKPKGQGTGLGLATVYGIVKQHDGMITAYSEPGKGTTFKVYLPQCERSAASVGSLVEGAATGGTETILLAEDEEMVRDLAVRILERAGYNVIAAADGEEAVVLFKTHAENVDLLLFDVVMPRLGGHDAYERIRALCPDIPVLFSSGYSENAIHTDFVLHEGLALLQKPYAPAALLRAVRTVLDARQPRP